MSAGWKEPSIREVIYSMRNGSCQMIFYRFVVILKNESYGKVGCGCIYFSIENLVLWARSEFNGFAGRYVPWCWSTGALEYWNIGLLKY